MQLTIELPDLDNRDFEQLSQTLIAAAPQYTADWNDFNPSDPGVALIELFAWLAESLLYRANRIPPDTEFAFAQWIAGTAGTALVEEIASLKQSRLDPDRLDLLEAMQAAADRKTLQSAIARYRTTPFIPVTKDDWDAIAKSANQLLNKGPWIGRAITTVDGEFTRVMLVNSTLPGYLEVKPKVGEIVLIAKAGSWAPSNAQIGVATTLLKPRLLAGSLSKVTGPDWTDVTIAARVELDVGMDVSAELSRAAQGVRAWLDPLTGGETGLGWPEGIAPVSQDIAACLAAQPGVRSVTHFEMSWLGTIELGVMASLGQNTRLGGPAQGALAPRFRGLPRLRLLSLIAESVN